MSIINLLLAGAGGGFEFESGAFTPTSNVTTKAISFSKTYPKPPAIMICLDATTSGSAASSNNPLSAFAFFDTEQILGSIMYIGVTSTQYKGFVFCAVGSNGSLLFNRYLLNYGSHDTSQTGTTATRGFATESGGTLRTSGSYNFVANRKYIWVALWLPDSWVQPT